MIQVLLDIDADDPRWRAVPEPRVWSVSKEAEHIVEAAAYHHWIVRRTIGEAVSSSRPAIERKEVISGASPAEAARRIGETVEAVVVQLRSLTEEQLDLPTRPPRARDPRLAETIRQVLIDHVDRHRRAIEAKLRPLP